MEFKIRNASKLVTLFIMIAIIILIATLVFTGDFTEFFSKKYLITSVFKDSEGLGSGVPVMLKDLDIEIGKVESVKNSEMRGQVEVVYSVIKKYADAYLKRDSVAFLETPAIPILGSTKITLTMGEDANRLFPLNDETNEAIINRMYLPSNQTQEGATVLSKNFYKEEGENAITSIINNIDEFTENLVNPEGPVLQTMANIEKLTNPTQSTVITKVNRILSSIGNLAEKLDKGDVSQLLGEPVYSEMVAILENINTLVQELGRETLGIIETVDNETLVMVHEILKEQNENISSLINDSVRTLVDEDIKSLLNDNINPAIVSVTDSINKVAEEVDTLLFTINGFVANSTTSINDLITRTTERVNVITEEVSSTILTTLQGITATITELEDTLLAQITSLLSELTTTISTNVNPAISEITEDVVVSIDTIAKGLTETIYELQLVIGDEARKLLFSLSKSIANIISTIDNISQQADEILTDTAPEIAEAIKSLSKAMKGLPSLVESLNYVLDTADLTLRRVDLVLDKLDSILSGFSGGDSLPLPGRTTTDSLRGDED